MNLDSSLVVEAAFLDCCPSTSSSNVTFVIRVSRRHADAFASRPDILSRAGLLVKFGRDFRSDDPICDHLVDWQQQQTAPRGIESIVLQGPVEQLKEVAIDLVQDVWLPRRMKSKMAQVHIPLRDANTALAPYISKGKFSKIAEDSEAVIAFEVSPQGTSFYQATIEGDRDSLTAALVQTLELLRPPEGHQEHEPVQSASIPSSNKRARTTARPDIQPLPRRVRRISC